MDLGLTEEQQLLQKSVREFAESEVRPLAKEHDETGHFPRALFKKAAELGLTGVPFPESQGGAGFDHVAYTIVIEEISRCCDHASAASNAPCAMPVACAAMPMRPPSSVESATL